MSIKFKALTIGLTYAAALTLGFNANAHASCTEEIRSSVTHFANPERDPDFGKFVIAGLSVSSSLAPAAGAAAGGAFSVSSTIDYTNSLSNDEIYALDILTAQSGSATLASFTKLVQKEISKDKNAVIPTEEDVLATLNYVDDNLIACRNAKEKFVKPTKLSLLKVVIEDLKTK